MVRFCNLIWFWRACWFHMILFLYFHSEVKLFIDYENYKKDCLEFWVLWNYWFFAPICFRPFFLLRFFSNLILIFCLLCDEYVLFILLCMFNFRFFLVGSVMVLWWDLSFVVIGFVIVWCVVESINQTHQTLVLCHLICKFLVWLENLQSTFSKRVYYLCFTA